MTTLAATIFVGLMLPWLLPAMLRTFALMALFFAMVGIPLVTIALLSSH